MQRSVYIWIVKFGTMRKVTRIIFVRVTCILLISLTTYSCIRFMEKRQEKSMQNIAYQLLERTTKTNALHKIRRNYLTETEALKDTPMTDIRETTYLKYSTARLANDRAVFNVGETIHITVVLKNGFRERKRKGGDILQVRILNEQLQAFAACHVIDHDNGIYTATVGALWPGKHTISITLAFRRELIRAVVVAQYEHKESTSIHGKFVTNKAEEETICHPKPEGLARYNYTEICNLTMDNGGMSWYCGKPSDQKLLCEDWTSIRSVRQKLTSYMSDTDLALVRMGQQNFRNISITVIGKSIHRSTPSTCSSIPARQTWINDIHAGYFCNNKWFPRYCRIPEKLNLQNCLKDKRLILFGDSTLRHWYTYLMNHLKCVSITEKWIKEKWHKRSSCAIKRLNFTMEWIPHAQPFHIGPEWDTNRYTTHSIADYLDGLHREANVVIVIHIFSHVNGYHMSVFRDRMRAISKSTKKILNRSKNAKVFIKGPHTHKLLGSMFTYAYHSIIENEFKDLHDSVYYLDQTALTIAKGNIDVHPGIDVVEAAVKEMLGYICV